ncbi:hypothetical protein XENOCAPTIV_014968, partial [Xenoophorus captivus]
VFCALCTSLKFRLTHLDGKEGRVCVSCHSTLIKRTPPRGNRRVWFADEILSGQRSESAPTTPVRGLTFSPLMSRAMGETARSPAGSPQIRRTLKPHRATINEACGPLGWGPTTLVSSSANLIPLDGLPPILTSTGVKGDYTVEEKPSEMLLFQELESVRPKPLVFVLNANLLAMVKLVNYVNRKCWCVTTKGMHAVGQVEVVVLLQCLPEEKTFPKDIFSHFIQLYRDTVTGKVVRHLSLFLFGSKCLDSEEHAGFLYVRSTLQSLQGLPLPNQPYLFGLLVHRAEVPWAKAFPLRLMLRLGAEYRCKQEYSMTSSSHNVSGVLLNHPHYFCLSSLPLSSVQRAVQEAPVWGNRSHHNETVSREYRVLQQLSLLTTPHLPASEGSLVS